jgi:hypothetical protein
MDRYKEFLIKLGLFSTVVLIFQLMSSYTQKTTYIPPYDLPQMVKPPKLDKAFTFGGEKIPINRDTRERLDREFLVNSYHHSGTILALKQSKKYFPTIERILAEEGVPDDFKYLAVAESNLANVVSPSGAKGIWQFMKAASSDYGLEVNEEVDERYHFEKATKAACKYIKRLYESDGSWLNAAAAYNVGPGNMRKLLNNQKEQSYFDLNMNEETSRYVFRLVAIKEVMENPQAFGYYLTEEDKYDALDTYEVEVTSSIPSLADFAHQHGTTYRLLKYYNPWLMDSKLTVKTKTYSIKLPR